MASVSAAALSEGQLVELDLGAKGRAVRGRVLGFGGSNVVVALAHGLIPADLRPGLELYVVVDDGSNTHALRGRVLEVAGTRDVMITITDPFQLGQRRRHSRAPIPLSATVRHGDHTWRSTTSDISASGARLTRGDATCAEGDQVELVLEAERAGLRIDAGAEVMWAGHTALGVRFTRIDHAHVTLLQQLAVAYYR